MNLLKKHTGQTLMEIVVAVGIISLVLVGVSDIISRSLNLTTFQSEKNNAVNLAQKQLNYYRGERDKAPTTFINNLDNYRLCQGTLAENGKIDGVYTCQISYQDLGSIIKMTVVVSWDGGKKDTFGQEAMMSTTLTQELAKPTK